MPNSSKTIFLIGLSIFFFLVYSSVLGTKGIWERRNLEARLEILQEEVEKLENESNFLNAKRRTLLEDKNALAKEASKYYILSDDAKIIHFKEPNVVENNDKLFASSIQVSEIKKKYKNETSNSPNFARFFYLFVVSSILIVIFFKLRE